MASVFISTPAEVVVVDSRTRPGTITLPNTNFIPNRVLSFKDQYGTFSNSTLTLSTQIGESFDDGTTSKVLSNAFSFMNLYAVSSKWMVLGASQTVQQSISSLTVNELVFGSGAGWVQFGPVQASIVSSIQVQTTTGYIDNLLIGTQSTINSAQFNGLFGNYNNTVLAEISTGAGTQELLVFKGSSSSDRVRFQTTGTFVVETGVSARLFNSNTLPTLSNTTPAFIINSSSNVGIQTASPGTTLDVAGTGRFQLVSTQALNVSSILASNAVVSSLQVNSFVIGTGTGWVNLGPLQTVALSSIQINTNDAYLNNPFIGIQSTINDIAFNGLFGNYNNTVLAEVSTGAGTQELLLFKGSSSSDRVRVQTTGNFVVETGVSSRLFNSNTLQTLSNATPAFIINTASNVGIQTASPGATLDVGGTGRFQTVSTQSLFLSSMNGLPFEGIFTSTVEGLGSAGYISSSALLSTTFGVDNQLISTTNGFFPILSTGSIFTSSITTYTLSTVNIYAATLNMSIVFV